jgi:hypothetical protein
MSTRFECMTLYEENCIKKEKQNENAFGVQIIFQKTHR